MAILEAQFLAPTHVAWPMRLAQEARESWEAGACLLLAAHRWLRLRIWMHSGFEDPRVASGRFHDLLAALADAGEADARLVDAAGRFLDPATICGRTAEETAARVAEIEAAFAVVMPSAETVRVVTTGPGFPGRVLAWRGPGGHATGPGDLEASTAATWLARDAESPHAAGPAAMGAVPYPLLPCPAPGGHRWFECPHGALYDEAGKRATPLGPLTAGRTLGRLISWGLTRERDGADLAERLAEAGMAEAAAELWLAAATGRLPRFDAQAVAAARAFFARHRVADRDGGLDDWLLREMDASETRLREAGDMRGLAETLVARQQLETADARARTIHRAANLFREHLDDPESALWCLLSFLEEHPGDEATLHDAFDLAGDDPEMRIRLLALRRDTARDPGVRAEAAAERAALLAGAGQADEALAEWRRALEADPNRTDAFDAVCGALLASGDVDAARALAEDLAGRLVSPGPRAHVLRRLATLPCDDAESAVRTESALAEALALEPGNPELVESLAACHAERGAWQTHLALLGRLAATTPERAMETWIRMADVAVDRMDDPLAALAFLAAAAAHAPDDPEPRRRIEALHERLGLWAEVARDLERRVQAGGNGRLAALLRLADVFEHRLSLRERTKETLWMALQEAPPEMSGELALRLAELHRADGERGRELDALAAAVRAGTDDEQTVELLVSMGRRALEAPADPSAARIHLEQALELNPVHPEAVDLACGLWLDAGQPERVVAALAPLAQAAGEDGDAPREARLRRLSGEAAAGCDDLDAALAQFSRVVALAPDDLDSRTHLGRLLARRGRHDEAMNVLAECLDRGSALPDRDAVLRTAADSALQAGAPTRALAWLEAVHEGAEPDLSLLRRRVEAAVAANDPVRETAHREALAPREAAGPDRYACLVRLGDLYRESLEDPATAMRWYQAAAAEGVSVKAALHKALDAAVAANERHEALAILQSMIASEPDGHAEARLHHAAALLAREVGDAERAREHLMKAIDLDPDLTEAVTALDEALAEEPVERAALLDRLTRHYRLSGQGDRLVQTQRRLGDLYMALHNPARAVEVLRQVREADPDDFETRVAVADTLTRIPGREAEALEAHRGVVAADPTRIESYRAIRELCRVAGDEDGAWCAAGVLAVLGQATDEERAAFEHRRQPTLRLRRDMLPTDGFVRWIRDEGETDGVARVMALLYEPLTALLPWKQPDELGLSEANRVDLEARTPFSAMAQAASRVFGVRMPRVYQASGRSGFAKAAMNPPALVVGDDVMNAWRGKELRFALGRAVVAFAPGHELAGLSDAAGIRMFFLAALRIAFPDLPPPTEVEGLDEMAANVARRLSPDATTALRDVLGRFRQSRRAIDIQAYLEGIDRSASRAGMFLANDIGIAAAVLQDDALSLSDLEYGDRLVDLCAWSVSSRHAELRRTMLKPLAEG